MSSQITETVSIPDNSIKIRTIGNYSKVEYGNNIYTDRIGYPSIPSVIKSYAIPIDAYDVRLGSSIAAKSYFPGQYADDDPWKALPAVARIRDDRSDGSACTGMPCTDRYDGFAGRSV